MKLLFFSQTFCNPCRQLKPVLTVAAHLAGVEIQEVLLDDPSRNEEENWAIAQAYGVTYTPTVFLVEDNDELHRLISTDPKRELFQGERLFDVHVIQEEIAFHGNL